MIDVVHLNKKERDHDGPLRERNCYVSDVDVSLRQPRPFILGLPDDIAVFDVFDDRRIILPVFGDRLADERFDWQNATICTCVFVADRKRAIQEADDADDLGSAIFDELDKISSGAEVIADIFDDPPFFIWLRLVPSPDED